MEQQFKVGDIVQVATMERLPDEAARNWAEKDGLKMGNDYTIEKTLDDTWVMVKESKHNYYHPPSRFKLKSSNMELKITKDKVLQAAAKCSTAKATLETLFPEAFEGDKKVVFEKFTGIKDINGERLIENRFGSQAECVWLNSDFKWKIEKAGNGGYLLIPTRKPS